MSLGEVKSIEVFLRRIPKRTGARVLLSVVTPEALSWAVEKQVAAEVIAAPDRSALGGPAGLPRGAAETLRFRRIRILAEPSAGSQTRRRQGGARERPDFRPLLWPL